MARHASRRTFLKTSGAVAATSLMGAAAGGCGGGDDDGPAPMTTAEQLALTSAQAIAAIQAGSL